MHAAAAAAGAETGVPSPYAGLTALDEEELDVLRAVGRRWTRAAGDPEQWRRALPVDTGMSRYPASVEPRPLGRVVPLSTGNGRAAEHAAGAPPQGRAAPAASSPGWSS
jgi:hypothetical protein